MTAQIEDNFYNNGKKYKMVAVSHPISFKPEDYGLTPKSRCTACWRGFWCDYEITEQKLFLKDLYTFVENEVYPEINGVNVSPQEFEDAYVYRLVEGKLKSEKAKEPQYMGHRVYKDIGLVIKYTGKILVGDGLIDKYYIHMGFQRPYAYKDLVEFVFKDGFLIEKINHSNDAKKYREKIDAECRELRRTESDNILRFVDDSFSLDYKVKAWWLEK